jgi:hypothetical protein
MFQEIGLVDFSNLNNLETISKGLTVTHSPNLISFDGLEKLSSSLTNLSVISNPLLNNINALNNIKSIEASIFIQKNPYLSNCSINSVCAHLVKSGQLYVGGNKAGCNNADEISISCSQSDIDDDNDGVMNNLDLCPNTPIGEITNKNGCTQSQIGDTDNDGVINIYDTCPGTPEGEEANTEGCSQSQIDDDSDGVMNNLDTCQNTPIGEEVNATGCSQSQIDDDGDGVMNNIDTCLNTPVGGAVNATGCSSSQLDDDNDGVSNTLDQCPNTPAGITVDYKGCPVLPSNNYKLEATNPTCQSKNNGKLKITATATYNYTATLDGKDYTFTNNVLEISDLAPKVYTICVKVPALNNYTQCFDFEVKAAPGLGARTSFDTKGNRTKADIIIDSGTAPYTIELNGKTVAVTMEHQLSIPVQNGDLITVKSSVACEGNVSEQVRLLNVLTAYPNPTSDFVELYIPTTVNQKDMLIQVINSQGKIVYQKIVQVLGNRIEVPMINLPTGLYMINAHLETIQTIKVIKK